MRIGMDWISVQFISIGCLHHPPEVHDSYSVRYMMHYEEVMSYEEISNTKLILYLLKHIDDLRLNGNIKRRNRLIAYYELGIYRKSSRYSDTLPLPAGEFVSITHCMLGV